MNWSDLQQRFNREAESNQGCDLIYKLDAGKPLDESAHKDELVKIHAGQKSKINI